MDIIFNYSARMGLYGLMILKLAEIKIPADSKYVLEFLENLSLHPQVRK